MGNVTELQRFRPHSSTLKEMHLEITDEAGHYPFITFRTMIGDMPLMVVTIPWARFREYGPAPDIYEVRSCDCDGAICKHPPQQLFIAKSLLHEWKFKEQNDVRYVFEHQIHNLGS